MENIIYQKSFFLFTADIFILSAYLVQAVSADIRKNKIRNRLVLSGWIAAVLQASVSGSPEKILAVPCVIILLWPMFAFRVIGAGDIKLLSVVGAFLGLKAAALVFILMMLFSASAGIILIIFRFLIKQEKYRFGMTRMPLSPFIFAGSIAYYAYTFSYVF